MKNKNGEELIAPNGIIYNNILYDFQKKVIKTALPKGSYYFAIEPGLGKTIMSLSLLEERKYKRVLIICQNSKVYDWKKEINKSLNGFEVVILKGNKNKREKIIKEFKSGILITNYEIAWRHDDLLSLLKLRKDFFLIIDECQYLKAHPKSSKAIAGSKIAVWGIRASYFAKDTLLLSGTPLNKPEDLFTQFKMLGLYWDWEMFRDTFLTTKKVNYPGARWWATIITGYKKGKVKKLIEIFNKVSYSLKIDDAIDLPPQNFNDIHLVLDKPKIQDFILENGFYEERVFANGGELFLRMRQLASGYIEIYKNLSNHKKIALKEFLETHKKSLIIFYNYDQELEDIREIFKELKIKLYEVNGHIKDGIDQIEDKNMFGVAINYAAGAEGINKQEVNFALFYSPPLTFIKYKQALGRIYRIGQEKQSFYYFFKTIDSIEGKIYRNVANGKDYNDKVFQKDYNIV